MKTPSLLAALAVGLCSCGDDRLAGGTSSEVPNALHGLVLDEQGRAVPGCTVRLASSGSHADSLGEVDSVVTDSVGRWSAARGIPGRTVLLQARQGMAIGRTDDGTGRIDTLRAPGWIVARLGAGWANGVVYVRGTAIGAAADSTGEIVLGPLPPGDLSLEVRADLAGARSRNGFSMHLEPGEIADVGSLLGGGFAQEEYGLWPQGRVAVVDLSSKGAAVTGDHPGFVVPVVLDTVLSLRNLSKVGIRFSDENGTHLPFSVPEWDPATNHAVAWVRLDSAHGSSDKHLLRVLWGRDVPVPSDMPPVFAANQGWLGAWDADSGSMGPLPSLAWKGANTTPGPIGAGRKFDVSGGWTADSLDLGGSASWTVSLWVRLEEKPSGEFVLAGFSDGPDSTRWGVSVRDDGYVRVWSGADSNNELVSAAPLAVGAWSRVSATFDGAKRRIGLVVDSAVSARRSVVYPAASRQKLHGGVNARWSVDEIRISGVERTTEWTRLEARTQAPGVPWLRWR